MFEMPCDWNFTQMISFLNTWSAVKKYEQENGINPLSLVAGDFEKAWGGEESRRVVFPLFVRAGRKN
jgi:hypothetical protein